MGGSSCAHSVRPDLFFKQGIPCVNMGYHAGAWAPFLISAGMSVAQTGDLVVIALEPGLLMGDRGISRISLVGAIEMGDLRMASGGMFSTVRVKPADYVFPIRPGGIRLAKQLAILITGFDAGKYLKMDEYGWMTCSRFVAVPTEAPSGYPGITTDNKAILESVSHYCKTKGIQVVCALPWRLWRDHDRAKAEAWDAQYIEEISTIMPVLLEESGAALVDKDLFSDTYYHLNKKGATMRTLRYLESLSAGNVVVNGQVEHMDLLSAIAGVPNFE